MEEITPQETDIEAVLVAKVNELIREQKAMGERHGRLMEAMISLTESVDTLRQAHQEHVHDMPTPDPDPDPEPTPTPDPDPIPDPSTPIFTPTSPFVTALPADAPIHPQSAEILQLLIATNSASGVGFNSETWGSPVYYSDSSDPEFNIISTKYSFNIGPIHIPEGAVQGDNADAEMVVYDYARGVVVLLSKANYTNGNWYANNANLAYLDGNGLAANVRGGDPRNGIRFRGQNGYVHCVTLNEVATGHVQKPMRLAIKKTGSKGHVWPLNGSDGESTSPYAIPQGALIRLKRDVDLDALNLHPQALAIGRGWQTHGLMVTDSSGSTAICKIESPTLSKRAERWEMDRGPLGGLGWENFEVIDWDWSSSREV